MLLGSQVMANKIDHEAARRITPQSNAKIPASILRAGDLVTVRVGDPGTTAVIADELDGCNCASMMIVRRGTSFNSAWLSHLMNSPLGRRQVANVQYGTAQKQFNIGDAVAFLFPVPSKAEQDAIADALTDADTLIDSLEQLLTKKRQIKQGAMQELLTGKRRLPGFTAPWISCTWGEVINDCSSGATPLRSRPEYYRGSIRWISSGELNYNVIDETNEYISSEAFEMTNLKLHPAGTFLMAITGLEAAGTRGACGIVGKPAATNQSCMAIYPSSKLLTAYLLHYYVYKGDELALRYCQGTKQQSYTAALIRVLPIEYPESTDEQLAIAQAFSDMDSEISALESRLTKARALKQAMAQALLTGRIRLVEGSAA